MDNNATAAALRNHLNQISAASQLLETKLAAPEDLSCLGIINQGICRILRTAARLELDSVLSGKGSAFSPRSVDLAPRLAELALHMEGVLAEVGITFTLTCPQCLPALADWPLVRQLVLELTAHLALEGTRITLTAVRQAKNIHLTVSDTGPGPAPGRPRLPAVLAAREENDSLDFARRIAACHGGTLMVSPAGEQGLSLAVSLPAGCAEDCACRLEHNCPDWDDGGFDPVLVGFSELLPARAFLPENLG